MRHHITVLPQKQNIQAAPGDNLLAVLRQAGLVVDAPCGGNGSCGKCRVLVDGKQTLACVLATGLQEKEEFTLLVDIGTNGEMVLGNKRRMVSCATAAGPALEGANITFGMRAQEGAIDHVQLNNGQFTCSVIGGGEATGICGSGIIDAVAAALTAGRINKRGNILDKSRRIFSTENIYLTQEDIRQVQLAKGAIAAGIQLLTDRLGVTLQALRRSTGQVWQRPFSACPAWYFSGHGSV